MKKKNHAVFSAEDKDKQASAKRIKEYVNSPEFDEGQYRDLLQGNYENADKGASDYFQEPSESDLRNWDSDKNDYVPTETDRGALINHPFNRPEINDDIFRGAIKNHDKALKEKDHKDLGRRMRHYDTSDIAQGLARHAKLSPEALVEHAVHPEVTEDISKNPGMNADVLHQIIKEHGPSQVSPALMKHPAFDETHARKILRSNTKLDRDRASALAERGMLDSKHAKEALETHAMGEHPGYMDQLLDHVSPEERTDYINRKLGIAGGTHDRPIGFDRHGTPVEDDQGNQVEEAENDFKDRNWQNWNNGPDAVTKDKSWERLGSSRHLSDEQADHIKRHAPFAGRMALYNNNKVDPKHGAEMWHKWYDDDSDHGYDQDDYKKHVRAANQDGQYDNHREEAEEEARENYPIEDYMRDAGIDHMYDEDDHRGEIAKSPSKYGTVGPNPNFDDSQPEHPEDNPSQIDFADPDSGGGHSYDIQDHPDYDEMREKADTSLQDSNGTPDHIYEGYDDSLRDETDNAVSSKYDNWVDGHLENEKELPKHLQGKIPSIEQMKQEKIKRENVGSISALGLDDHYRNKTEATPDQDWQDAVPLTHEYGEGQHHLEMLRDAAQSNGGAVDIGSMNKQFPTQKETWKKHFGPKGKLTTQEAQEKVDQLPKQKYGVSYGVWGKNKMQNLNGQDELVARLDHSPDTIKQFQSDPALMQTFKGIQQSSQRSGHPTNDNTIAWSRIDTSNPKHWLVDELQSDFGTALRQKIENAQDADPAVKDQLLGHLNTIEGAHKGWRETLLNHIVKMAKDHGVEKLSTHSPESKAAHTGADTVHSVYKDSYQKVPRSLGFQPVEADALPLTERGKESFQQVAKTPKFSLEEMGNMTPDQYKMKLHKEAIAHHGDMYLTHSKLANPNKVSNAGQEVGKFPVQVTPGDATAHQGMADKHRKLYESHFNAARELDPADASIKGQISGSKVANPEQTYSAATTAVGKGQFASHKGDSLVEEGQVVGSHKGHTLMLKPALTKAFDDFVTLAKSTHDKLLSLRAKVRSLKSPKA